MLSLARTLRKATAHRAPLFALTALLAGCAARPAEGGYLPPSPAIVDVVEQDRGYTFGGPKQVPAGRIVFRVRNPSDLVHDLSLVALPEDMPPIDDQLRSGDRRAVVTIARLPSRPPGSSDAFAVDLPSGRYALVCFERDGSGKPHALMGMAVEFRVVSGTSDAQTGG